MNKRKYFYKIYRIVLLLLSLIINAIVYNLFLLPLKLVTGGTAGIATITTYLYGIDPSIMILLISMSIIIISIIYLGFEKTSGAILASFLYPILIKLTSGVIGIIDIQSAEVLLLVIIAGVLYGIGNGLMCKSGYGGNGFFPIAQILYEKFKISVSKTTLAINVCIVLVGAVFFGFTNALYAIIFLYINSIVLDKVLLGISNNKAFYIVTSKEEIIKEYIINNLKHTVTIFEVKGGLLEKKRRVILTVIPTREYYKVTEGIKEIDKDAFFLVTDSYQVEGAK